MPTRRTILQSAAALSAAPLAPNVVFADGARAAAPMGAVFDARHRDARVFRLRASQWNVPIRGIEGDITDLWQGELRALWKSRPAALAGLTERPALFLLEQLGFDYGMRVVFQAEHEARSTGSWIHRIVRSGSSSLKSQLEAAGVRWPAVLADQLLTAPQAVASKDSTPSRAAMAAYLDEPTKLYSWIIAPKAALEHI